MEITGTLEQENFLDDTGRPAGGSAQAVGFRIDWQDGPLGRGHERKEPNGAFIGDVLAAVIGRLEFYQASPFACKENEVALTHIQTALLWLEKRTKDRVERGVEGTHNI